MKKTMTVFWFLLITNFVLISCNDGNKNSGQANSGTTAQKDSSAMSKEENPVSSKETDEKVADAEFAINPMDSDDNPASEIWVIYNGKKTKIDKIAGQATITDVSEYPDKGIPKDAVSACGSWWAGAGDYFYLVPSEKGVIVYRGWQDEEQEDVGYHWEKLTEINK